jgi:hypothetical protein
MPTTKRRTLQYAQDMKARMKERGKTVGQQKAQHTPNHPFPFFASPHLVFPLLVQL